MFVRLAFKILPPSDPTTKTFLFDLLWHMLKALTGITTPYFFLNIENPFIGFLKRVFILFEEKSSPKTGFGTSHKSIFPSVERESKLYCIYDLPGGLNGHQQICEMASR
jgi:hypothetical protein